MAWLLIIFIVAMFGQCMTLGKRDENNRLKKEIEGNEVHGKE